MTSSNTYGTSYTTDPYGSTSYGTTTYGTASNDYNTTYNTYGDISAGGANRTTYDPTTGAYDQHIDYNPDSTTRRHHREQMDESGRYYHRDVDRDTTGLDNTVRVHKEYSNPNTGTSYTRDSTYDRNNLV